jgi:hypothetical protein
MARVVLDIPTEKIPGFIQLILKLGIDKHAISSSLSEKKDFPKTKISKPFRLFSQKFLLFDWEFFSNELEFE